MIWSHFYLICFAVGFVFSLLSFLLGGLHWHLPHFWHGHVSLPAHAGHAAHTPGHATKGTTAGKAQTAHVSPLNPMTLAAFLTWFGGTGYLLTRYSTIWFMVGLGIAIVSGMIGGAIIYFFLARVLISKDENLDSANYEMTGVLGRTSVPIREGGTGEIIYSQAGTRRTCGAKTEDGSAIPKGSDVVVTRYEKGIAYVRSWEDDEEQRGSRLSESAEKTHS
ncbi:MAG TPA: hypothetical protein VFG11_11090 [Acidobacteriota bacterium]|nr:hypothetical protein [Acidobacteriota bacterium]